MHLEFTCDLHLISLGADYTWKCLYTCLVYYSNNPPVVCYQTTPASQAAWHGFRLSPGFCPSFHEWLVNRRNVGPSRDLDTSAQIACCKKRIHLKFVSIRWIRWWSPKALLSSLFMVQKLRYQKEIALVQTMQDLITSEYHPSQTG